MKAVMEHATLPAIIFEKTRRAICFGWFGAIEVRPPIAISMELKFANPQSANDATASLRFVIGFVLFIILARSKHATNSFTDVFLPRRVAFCGQSCLNTPVRKSTGYSTYLRGNFQQGPYWDQEGIQHGYYFQEGRPRLRSINLPRVFLVVRRRLFSNALQTSPAPTSRFLKADAKRIFQMICIWQSCPGFAKPPIMTACNSKSATEIFRKGDATRWRKYCTFEPSMVCHY